MFSDPLSILDSLGISAGMIVGDFGAGGGAYARELVKRVGNNGAVYAFDVQKDLVTRLAAEAKAGKMDNLYAIWANLEARGGTTLADASLDAAILANVIFQSEDKAGIVAEAARALRNNGRLLIVDWSDSSISASRRIGPHPDQVVTKEAARKLAESAGLTFEKEIESGEHHYGLLFRKS